MKLTEIALSVAIDDLREKKQRAQRMHERSKEQLSRLLGEGHKWTNGVALAIVAKVNAMHPDDTA